MITPSFSPEQTLEINHIILDTADLIEKLRLNLTKLEELGLDEKQIVESTIQALAYRKQAETEVEYNYLDLVREHLDTDYANDALKTAEVISAFGKELYKQLFLMGAYKNGYLFYQFMKLIGKDIVLVRIVPPALNKWESIHDHHAVDA